MVHARKRRRRRGPGPGPGRRRPLLRALGDTGAWSSLSEAVALFNAAALVTGDGAVGLHVGEKLLYVARPHRLHRTPPGPRLPRGGVQARRAALAEHFETTQRAVALEMATDHALIQVRPAPTGRPARPSVRDDPRASLPGLRALRPGPALITETECSARGGRYCLYALSWEDPSDSGCGDPGRRCRPSEPGRRPVAERRVGSDEMADRDRATPAAEATGRITSTGDGRAAGGAQPDERADRRRVRHRHRAPE